MEIKLSRVLNKIENQGSNLLHILVFVVLAILNPGHRFEEVKHGKMIHDERDDFLLPPCTENVEIFCLEMEKSKEAEEDRRMVIDDKNKVLLTVGGLLLTANATVLSHVTHRWVALLPFLPLVVAIFLVLVYYRTQGYRVVDLKSMNWLEDSKDVKYQIAIEHWNCGKALGTINDFRVGVYRAARRALLVGLLLLLPVLLLAGITDRQESKFLNRLKEDQVLVWLLQESIEPMCSEGH